MADITESDDDCQQKIDVDRLDDDVEHNNLGEPEQAETIAWKVLGWLYYPSAESRSSTRTDQGGANKNYFYI